jgi:PKD repeat protein
MPRERFVGDFGEHWGKLFPVGVQEAPKKAAPPFQLGRAKPIKQFDYGNFRAVVGTDGKTRYFPRLTKHVDTALRAAPIPASVNYGVKAPNVLKTMLGNDQQGCCVLSSRGHRVGIALANDTGKEVLQTTSEALTNYHAFCGAGDNGCNMSAVNQLEQSKGILYGGVRHKTDGAAAVDHLNVDLVKTALIVFGNLEVGMSLPQSWYQSDDGADWGITNSGIVGGHEVQAFGFDDKGVWISTWGGVRRILWAAFTSKKWIDEVYTTLAVDWYGADNLAPNGITVADLKADLTLIVNGTVPPLPDPNPPPVPGKLTLTATPSSGQPPLTVAFLVQGNGVGGKLDFGDGQQTTVYPVNHVYAAAGTYTATVKTATESASVVVSVGVVPPQPPVGVLGAVTTDPSTGTITVAGPWKIKVTGGSLTPSLADELAGLGISDDGIKAVIAVIDAMKKSAKSPGPGMHLVPRRRFDREAVLAA